MNVEVGPEVADRLRLGERLSSLVDIDDLDHFGAFSRLVDADLGFLPFRAHCPSVVDA